LWVCHNKHLEVVRGPIYARKEAWTESRQDYPRLKRILNQKIRSLSINLKTVKQKVQVVEPALLYII